MKKSGLGKGLDALFLDNTTAAGEQAQTLRLSEIEPNRQQPRQTFTPEALEELAQSIAQHGVLQPIVVRPLENGGYQIVAGERRWRASRMAGLTEVPVVIKQLDDLAAMEIALIENLQREDLNPVEEAEGYRVLMQQHGMTQEQVAQRVGKSRPAVANALRLLQLPTSVLEGLRAGDITPGHAKALAGLEDKAQLEQLAAEMQQKGLTVRQVEALVRQARQEKQPKPTTPPAEPAFGNHIYTEVALALQEQLGRRVKITPQGEESGKLEVEFFSQDDLLQLAGLLSQ